MKTGAIPGLILRRSTFFAGSPFGSLHGPHAIFGNCPPRSSPQTIWSKPDRFYERYSSLNCCSSSTFSIGIFLQNMSKFKFTSGSHTFIHGSLEDRPRKDFAPANHVPSQECAHLCTLSDPAQDPLFHREPQRDKRNPDHEAAERFH
jgi:hypothetical protein